MNKTLKKKANFDSFFNNRILTLGALLVIIIVAASIAFPKAFPTMDNLKSVLLNTSIDAIVASAMMILLISGVFDLSVGSMLAFSGGVVGRLMLDAKMDPLLAIICTIAICVAVGAFTGFLIAKVGVNPMITTLSMMTVLRGGAMLLCGAGILGFKESFLKIADTIILELRSPIWFMVGIGIILTFLVSKTRFFRRFFYIGGNEKAASLSGINVERMRIYSFMISAGMAAFCGILLTSRLTSAVSTTGNSQEMRAISACIIGGASLSGGQGTIPGAMLGALFIGLINNLLIVGRVPVYWQNIVVGFVLLIAVILDVALMKRSKALLLKRSMTEQE